ncbi:hypothetical protein EZV62_021374 [Acer yangbiense]|uniref:Tubby-like F-box protein n=1 Tax=Acer yangbiense TaxID=1000413 RepID=A0A5C7H6I0_9ROSI|nr:hypothetical protein EZV62_021374 [Acer yangbiense]
MTLKNIVRELKEMRDGIGNISRRSFDGKHTSRRRGRSYIAPEGSSSFSALVIEQSRWANLPSELLLDIIQRIEGSKTTWPGRRDVVACGSVCKSWRAVTKELVRTPEQCGLLTFPVSLKQPGPRDSQIQCFIKRERPTGTYRLYLGLSPGKYCYDLLFFDRVKIFVCVCYDMGEGLCCSRKCLAVSSLLINCLLSTDVVHYIAALSGDMSKLLLAARKVRRATSTDFMISLVGNDFSRTSNTYVGKLRSNFLGTKFTIYDSQPPCNIATQSNYRSNRKTLAKQGSASMPASNYNVATISYELNILRTRGPRRMQCTIPSIPISAIQEGGNAPTPMEFSSCRDEQVAPITISKGKKPLVEFSSTSLAEPLESSLKTKDALILKNKAPRWHEQLQCWCLNFKGRVTVASVKNFQLVASAEACHNVPMAEQEKVIVQFGKIGKDIFTMDYRYPLSAFQAFAICLSSFDTKPACE